MKCPVFSDERLERLGKEYSENDDEDIMECDICGTRFVGLSKPCPVCKSIMVSTAV